MVPVNYLAIIAATLAAFLFSALYYFLLNKKIVAIRESYVAKDVDANPGMSFNKLIIEITRTFVVGLAMSYAVINAQTLVHAAVVVVWLWIAFPVVLLVGSVIHERYPASLAFIHAIDWLVKLMIIATIITLWR